MAEGTNRRSRGRGPTKPLGKSQDVTMAEGTNTRTRDQELRDSQESEESKVTSGYDDVTGPPISTYHERGDDQPTTDDESSIYNPTLETTDFESSINNHTLESQQPNAPRPYIIVPGTSAPIYHGGRQRDEPNQESQQPNAPRPYVIVPGTSAPIYHGGRQRDEPNQESQQPNAPRPYVIVTGTSDPIYHGGTQRDEPNQPTTDDESSNYDPTLETIYYESSINDPPMSQAYIDRASSRPTDRHERRSQATVNTLPNIGFRQTPDGKFTIYQPTYPKIRRTTKTAVRVAVSITTCFIFFAVGIPILVTLLKQSNEGHVLPNVIVTDLKGHISANVSVPQYEYGETDTVTISSHNGYKVKVDVKGRRRKRHTTNDQTWTVSSIPLGDGIIMLSIEGPPARCTSGGMYNVTLEKRDKVVFETTFTVRINNAGSTSGSLIRFNEKEKMAHCKFHTVCLRLPMDMSRISTDVTTEALLDVSRECISSYTEVDGFMYECTATTNYSSLVCGPIGDNIDLEGSSQLVISECDSQPCEHGGTCDVLDGAEDFTCQCQPGFEGRHCEMDRNECASNPCRSGATCTDLVNSYLCTCSPGYKGITCNHDVNECSSDPCQNEGLCTDQVNRFTCVCKDGFTGIVCQTDIDECASVPCQHGSTCVDLENSYVCRCTLGYTGQNCEIDIDECSSTPCDNGGTCTDKQNGYTCLCQPGYIGINCQTDQDECNNNPCINGGTCSDLVNEFTCQCLTGYTGTTCEIEIDHCEDDPCNSGTCSNNPNGYECACASGYTGPQCQTALPEAECDSSVTCFDHASCVDGICLCTSPYITSKNGEECTYGCSSTCDHSTGNDFYAILGPVCGGHFKRCVQNTQYNETCPKPDVFDTDSCVCVPPNKATWCQNDVTDIELKTRCSAQCSKNDGN